ncbi:hypothetical protein [Paenarthrobacter nitroguajacolicus]|uniref:hypothetical protein n=1 Tax=Paenarthrobacter nitroguajacolicus TaxID=211146 RepID=UPI00286B9D20|nr:hypothetical protein [Paenarthrobacter nitroguajacolicus]
MCSIPAASRRENVLSDDEGIGDAVEVGVGKSEAQPVSTSNVSKKVTVKAFMPIPQEYVRSG